MSVLLDRARRGSLPSRERLLAAVAASFAFDGAVFGSWAARIPDVTTQVGTSHTGLGVALLCVSIGALASMQLAGARCTRLGAGRVAVVSAVLICVAVTLPGFARSLPELAVALLAFGAATGAVNVAANSAGVRIVAAGDAMACGRLSGGRLVRSFGATHVLVHGSALAAVGMLAAALAPATWVALVGFALVGLGLANVFPLAIARAGALGGSKGVAMASTVGYTGLLGGPPVISLLVGGVGLPGALATVSLLAAVAAGLSLYATPQRALLHARVADALDAGRDQAVAGLTPAVLRYGPAVRRWAGDLALLGPAAPGPARTPNPLTAVYLR